MKILKVVLILFLFSTTSFPQSFNPFLNHLNSLPLKERQQVADNFFNNIRSLPVIESDTSVYFIYQEPGEGIKINSSTPIEVKVISSVQHVSIAGDFTGWKPDMTMLHIEGTNIWYAEASFEPDARVEYKFIINGDKWIMDSKNPYTRDGGFGSNSELRMPKYVLPTVTDYNPSVPHGAIHDTVIYSSKLANRRTVKVYLPPGYDKSTAKYPVIVFHDGSDYLNFAQANNVLDLMIRNHEIEPMIGIFVDPVEREAEYAGKKVKPFTYFIIHELMPLMEGKYAISKDPHKRATVGPSLGGNIVLSLGITDPGCFGKIAAQSPFVSKEVSDAFRKGKTQVTELELYVELGKYDLYNLIPIVHDFIPVLKQKKYNYRYYEFPEGHSWGSWKAHLSILLKQFFPYN
jgi:enterochelin esterase-like enzyme